MLSQLLSGLGSGPILIFTVIFGAVLAALAYLFARPFDENRAFWIACAVLAVGLVIGIAAGVYGVCLMGILAAIGVIVYCGRTLPRRTVLGIGSVLLVVWLCFIGIPYTDNPDNKITKSALANRLVYDDKDLLEANDFLTGFLSGAPDLKDRRVNYWGQLLTRDFAQLAQKAAGAPGLNAINYYRPVIAMSYAMDTYFWARAPAWPEFSRTSPRSGLTWTSINPVGYHLFNVLVHALNALLLFLVIRSLSRNHWLAVVTAVLFAAHPIHTETVTWIAGRTDGLGTTFFLSAFWAYLRFRNSGSWRALLVGALLFVVGIFTKEAIAPLGLVLAAYELVRFVASRRGAGDLYLPADSPRLLEKDMGPGLALLTRCAVALVMFFVGGLIIYFSVKAGLAGDRPEMPPQADSWFDGSRGMLFPAYEIWLTFQKAAFWYLGKCLWPWPLEIYPNVLWASAGLGMGLMLAHALIVGGAVALLFVWPRARILALGVLGFYLCLAPLSCVFKFARLVRFAEDIDFPVSERFLYIPSIFVMTVVAWVIVILFPRLLGRIARPLGAVIVIVAVGLSAVACHQRAIDWYSDYNLFRSGVRTSPTSVRMSNNFGFELMQDWDIKRARKQLMRCTQLQSRLFKMRPPMPTAYQNLGHSYYMQGEFDQAVEYYRKSFQIDPKNAVAANNLGALMGIFGSITMRIDLVAEGLRYYQEAVKSAPNYVYAQSSMRFMRNVYINWERYLKQKLRTPPVVWSFGNSFLFAARSISESEDPKYLQAMQILDSGLRNLPSQEEMEKIFTEYDEEKAAPPDPNPVLEKEDEAKTGDTGGDQEDPDKPKGLVKTSNNPRHLRKTMAEVFARSFKAGVEKYQGLLDKHVRKRGPDARRNAALNFLMGEVYRVGWRRNRSDERRRLAEQHLNVALAEEPDHAGATRGLAEIMRARGEDREAMDLTGRTITALLELEVPWEEDVPKPAPVPRTRQAFELAKEIARTAVTDLDGMPGPEAVARRLRWKEFLEKTTRRCLDAQLRAAEELAGGQDAESWNNLGYFYIMAYKDVFEDPTMLQTALGYLDKSMGLDPGRQGPALNKIHVLQLQGRNQEAEALRRSMQQRFPGDVRFQPPPTAGAPPGQPPPGMRRP